MTARKKTSEASVAGGDPVQDHRPIQGARDAESAPDSGGETCEDCGETFRSAQGLAGHRRLKHRLGEASVLEQRASELETSEADLLQRRAELESSGPADRGMLACPECGSWLEDEDTLRRHRRTIHPIENAVAGEVGVLPERVVLVWREAARKQERHPGESPEQIVRRFWDRTDRTVLERLLARNASFRFSKEEE